MKHALLTFLLALLTLAASASQPRGLTDLPDPSVDAELKAFVVPAGFEINLWAGEPMLRKPVQMNWDAQGRLWVVCSTTYPQIKPGEPAIDQVVVLQDTDNDGKADKSTVFAEDLHIPTALLPADGGCYVANSTETLFLKDTNGDGKADERRTVLSGFGTEDTHHLIHTFRFTPEGMLSFNQSIYIHSHVETPWGVRRLMGGGVWEFRPETRKLEIFCKGFINPWGREFDRWGQSFVTDGAGSGGINFAFPGSVFATSPGAKRIIDGLNPGQPKQSGLEIIEDPHFPDDWQDTFVTCDFRGNRLNRFALTEAGSGYASKQLPDVLASTHRGFRPIDVRTGPDGALYIADWFNPIIQHGEVDFRDPRRDRTNGRIWRLTAKGRQLSVNADFAKMDIPALIEQLSNSRRWNRQFAKQELRNRDAVEVKNALNEAVKQFAAVTSASGGYTIDLNFLPEITKFEGFLNFGQPIQAKAKDAKAAPPIELTPSRIDQPIFTSSKTPLLELAWAKESINQYDAKLCAQLLAHSDHRIRAASLRILSHHLHETRDAMKHLEKAIADDHPQVRLWALGCLNILAKPEGIPIALRVLDKPMDNNLDFLLELKCRDQAPSWLPVFTAGKLKLDENPKHLVYALKATGKPEALNPLMEALSASKLSGEDAAAVLALVGDAGQASQVTQLMSLAQSANSLQVLDAIIAAGKRGVTPVPSMARGEFTAMHFPKLTDPAHYARRNLIMGLWKEQDRRRQLEGDATMTSGWLSQFTKEPTPEQLAEIRDSAIRGLLYLGGDKTKTFLEDLAQKAAEPEVRIAAINGLSESAPSLAAKHAVDFLASSKSAEEAKPVLEAFLKNKKLPVALAKELEGKTIPEAAAIEGIRLASSKGMASLIEDALRKAGNIKQMDKPLTAEEMTAMVEKVAKLGDPARGEQVYRRAQLQCTICHAIGGVGGVIGPDMVSLGASAPVDYLIESLLNPTAKIKEGYHMTMVTTKDGQVFAGGVAQDGADELVLRDATNNLHKIAKANIKEKQISPISLMPPGLTMSLREDEFLDLVRFLSELGREGPFKTQPNRYIRTWRTMGVMEQVDIDHVRHVGLFALNDRTYKYPWEMKLSLVNGDIPLSELPVPVKMYPWFPRIAQCDLEMPAAGKVKLKLSATKGVLVAANDKIVQEVTEELTLDLPSGKSTVSFVISREAGELPAFRVEILDGPAKVVTAP
jgi:putative heme-binding domain-containing protein